MKVMITGSRTILDWNFIAECLKEIFSKYEVDMFIHGNAFGVDKISACIVDHFYQHAIIKVFLPKYTYGKAAPLIRNKDMVEYCDKGFAIWNGWSTGTKHAINELKKADKLIKVFKYNNRDIL